MSSLKAEWFGRIWSDAEGLTYLNTHDASPSLSMGDQALELGDLAIGFDGRRVRIVIDTIEDEDGGALERAGAGGKNE